MVVRHFSFIVWVVTFLAVGGWFAAMRFDTQIPYEYISGTIKPDPAIEGGRVTIIWKIKVHRVCPVSIQRELLDDTNGDRVAVYDPLPAMQTVKMGDQELRKTFLLPEDLPPRVRYVAIACFKCNPLQKLFPLCVNTPDVAFNVRDLNAGRGSK